MRTLSLVECVELSFSGSVLEHALCFGDCDNDGLNEFVIGSCDGELWVYRDSKCIYKAMDLGTVSAVAIGDLLNISRNVLVAVTVEGWCHVFQLDQNEVQNQEKDTDADVPNQFLTPDNLIFPFHSQRIPPNTKILHLEDVNGDGLIEMIVGLTDRVLRTYQWKLEACDESGISGMPNLIYSADHLVRYLTPLNNISDENKRPFDLVIAHQANAATFKKEEFKEDNLLNEIYDGRLFGMNKWEFPSQIGSVALHKKSGRFSMLVGHPGATLTQITEIPSLRRRRSTAVSGGMEHGMSIGVGSNSVNVSSEGGTCTSSTSGCHLNFRKGSESPPDNITIDYYDLNTAHDLNPVLNSEVIGNVMDELNDESYALASSDGTILIAKEDRIQWKFQLQTQFLSLRQLDGKIFACSGDGEIYIIDRQEPTHFHFEESVAAFEVGVYGISQTERFTKSSSGSEVPLKNRKCFACVTFHQKVYIYPVDVLRI